MLEILNCYVHNSGTVFSTGAADTFFFQCSRLDVLVLTRYFQFCVRLSAKCNGLWVFFFLDACYVWGCNQSLKPGLGSFCWPFSHLLCVWGISVLFHQTILTKLIMRIAWFFCYFGPTKTRAGALSKLPECSGWTTATQTSTHQCLTNIKCVKNQNKEIFLKIRKWCNFWSVPGFYQQRFF